MKVKIEQDPNALDPIIVLQNQIKWQEGLITDLQNRIKIMETSIGVVEDRVDKLETTDWEFIGKRKMEDTTFSTPRKVKKRTEMTVPIRSRKTSPVIKKEK